MRFRVEWTDTARADLDAVLDYIAQDSPNAAVSVFGRVVQAAGRLDAMPLRGRVVPELARVGVCDFRELVVSPWRIVYQVVGNTVNVLCVIDGRRDLEDLLLERFAR